MTPGFELELSLKRKFAHWVLVEGKRIWSANTVLYPALSVSLDCWPSLIAQAFLSPDKSLSKPSNARQLPNCSCEEWIVVKIPSPQGQGWLLIKLDHRRSVSLPPLRIKTFAFLCHRRSSRPVRHDSLLTSEGFVIARERLRQVLEKLHADTLQT